MKIYLGSTCSKRNLERFKENGWGRIMTPAKLFKPYTNEVYAVDNGGYYCWKNGEKFNDKKFLKLLDYVEKYHKPQFGVVPDIVAGGNESLEYSLKWFEKLPVMDWYLAVQDSMDVKLVIQNIDRFAGLFLGGTDKFKQTANYWRKIAHVHYKKFHYGRAGTYFKLRHAYLCRSDSLDSSFPLWTNNRLKEFEKWTKMKNIGEMLFCSSELGLEY